jgi:hypothetical protein
VDEGGDGSGVALEIACQAPETTEPGKGAFDDPALLCASKLGYEPDGNLSVYLDGD